METKELLNDRAVQTLAAQALERNLSPPLLVAAHKRPEYLSCEGNEARFDRSFRGDLLTDNFCYNGLLCYDFVGTCVLAWHYE